MDFHVFADCINTFSPAVWGMKAASSMHNAYAAVDNFNNILCNKLYLGCITNMGISPINFWKEKIFKLLAWVTKMGAENKTVK